MITKMRIRDVATYDNEGVLIEDLKKINFFYGNNGSGKTTITEVIRNEDSYPSCSIDWQDKKMVPYVYNRNFVNENFRLDNPIKGIFTLGKESVDLKLQMDELKNKIKEHEDSIVDISGLFREKDAEKTIQLEEFKQNCWTLKKELDEEFKDLIEGYRNSKDRFMNKCIEESQKLDRSLKPIEEIRAKKESIFDRPVEQVDNFLPISYDESLENNPIFTQKIIGKDDVDISALITELNISDWVQEGYTISKNSAGICPFCQQTLPNKFEEKLNSYFDQTYIQQIEELRAVTANYQRSIENILEQIDALQISKQDSFIGKETITRLLELIRSKYEENKLLIEQKQKEPSRVIELVRLSSLITDVNTEISEANLKVNKYNEMIRNLKVEKENLIKDMWRFIAEKNKPNIEEFNKKMKTLERIMGNLDRKRKNKDTYKEKHQKDLLELQEQSTSVEHSVNEINKTLRSFGFKNFQLATTGEKGNYKIVRENGEEVKDTLSEGEKTFITFLYFYQLLNGSNSKEEIVTDKIVIIDDPISSLDSNVLFMVSTLVRQLMFEMKEKTSDIKQLFIFTHNIYFHKEITFNQGKKSYGEGGFWIVRKIDDVTSIQQYEENPIKTSYELLWKELKNRGNHSVVSIQNVMRRILENYFKFFGNINLDELENKFELEEKMICRSLISWINDGSHYISEDLYVENNEVLVGRYMDVFKNIFYSQGHEGHFDMMMGEYQIHTITGIKEEPADALAEIKAGLEEAAVGNQEENKVPPLDVKIRKP
ncbi:wobble nucleotide-excising tRNase [Evansella vedderi]|uniref:Wobble nucleotide-excising tRNase n=1 Tax=Evansella vedderi TaxID=38282 RepID=A0ABT9ZRS0_9BACI|nr:AAA family ATPase [Evansella vedderi]MDQ0253934.1 wobble nucleotide-excising tRNase [Evansella vedderi]